jgi:KDO2-lipid IV(A) lauroyltransferase
MQLGVDAARHLPAFRNSRGCCLQATAQQNRGRIYICLPQPVGAKPLAMRDSTKELVRRRSEFKIFAMVADQSPTRKERGYWTNFLNRPAAFYEGAEKIALLTQNPVIFVHMRRVRRGHYEIRYEPLAEPPHDKENAGITEAYIEAAERSIRSQPESWLWSNRRWKRSPEAVTDAVNASA